MSLVLGVFPFQGSAGFLQFCKKLDMPYDGYGRILQGSLSKSSAIRGLLYGLRIKGLCGRPCFLAATCWAVGAQGSPL